MEVLPSNVVNGPGVEARQSADTFPAWVRAAACHPCTTDFSEPKTGLCPGDLRGGAANLPSLTPIFSHESSSLLICLTYCGQTGIFTAEF